MVIAFIFVPEKWVKDPTYTLCLHKRIFGIECPFCGMTKAFYEVFHLNMKQAVIFNFAVFPFLLFLISVVIYFFFPLNTKKLFYTMLFISLAFFLLVYILRLAGLY